jgi:hypothetical protein
VNVPKRNPAANFLLQEPCNAEIRYERGIVRYVFSRYNVPANVRRKAYDQAERTLGERRPTMEIVEQHVRLPLFLRPRVLFHPTDHVTIPSVLNSKAMSGYLGKSYRDVRGSCNEAEGVICMCFGYPYLKMPGSAASLAIHDSPPPLEEIAESRGMILCPGDDEMELWVVEPLGQLLDRLDAEEGLDA